MTIGSTWKIWLHYGQRATFAQGQANAVQLGPFEEVTRVQWRGECSYAANAKTRA